MIAKNTGIIGLKILTPKNIIEYILKTIRENKTDIWAWPLLNITPPLYKYNALPVLEHTTESPGYMQQQCTASI